MEYLDAFRWYASVSNTLVDTIVILENSGADLSPFKELHEQMGSSKRLIALNTSSDYDASRGKGFGEFMMVDAGISEMERLGVFKHTNSVWKITGRLKIANIEDMLATAPKHFDVYCDLRRVPLIGETLGGNRWMDLRLVAFTSQGYKRFFKGRYADGYVLEKELFELAYSAYGLGDPGIIPRFKIQPRLIGVSGYSGRSYTSAAYRLKDGLRMISRKLLPALWL